ncbi:MAG: tRNA 2-thiouridine(34) synthase MnmA [Spirochaetota bacterium]
MPSGTTTIKRHAVLLSGGVDSSTALAELVRQGLPLTAFYLKVWLEDEFDHLGGCPWEEDLAYARAVCERFDVELRVVPLQLEYYERVVAYTLDELRAGRTPSPDIFCNERIKFGAFFDYLLEHEVEQHMPIATGHYARILDRGDHVELARSPDPVKDQTYFLSHLHQEQLRRIVFPIGSLEKEEVRRRAHELDLPNKARRDSQGICFLGRIRYPEFVRHYLGERPGDIVELETGAVLGPHRGYWFYTIGQRTGLGLSGGPWYVVRKDPPTNVVYVSHSRDADDRARRSFAVTELSWTWRPPEHDRLLMKIRHGPDLIDAAVRWVGEQRIEVTMDRGDRGVAPGQFAVFYDGEVCLGCGKIADDGFPSS